MIPIQSQMMNAVVKKVLKRLHYPAGGDIAVRTLVRSLPVESSALGRDDG
jgi:hypothetical protein